jgi:hypothetical protein
MDESSAYSPESGYQRVHPFHDTHISPNRRQPDPHG